MHHSILLRSRDSTDGSVSHLKGGGELASVTPGVGGGTTAVTQ